MNSPVTHLQPAPKADSHWHPPRRSLRTTVVIIVIALIGLGCVLSAWRFWPFDSSVEHTEDAYVRGNTTVVSPQVSGYVTRVLVSDFDFVRAGQPLVTIDDRIYGARVREAQAAL